MGESKETILQGFQARKRQKIQENFLRLMGAGVSVVAAARACKVSRAQLYRWKDSEPEFEAAWIEARTKFEAHRLEQVEDASFENAMAGSATMQKFLLQSYAPETYTERHELEIKERVLVWDLPIPKDFLDRLPPEQQALLAEQFQSVSAT